MKKKKCASPYIHIFFEVRYTIINIVSAQMVYCLFSLRAEHRYILQLFVFPNNTVIHSQMFYVNINSWAVKSSSAAFVVDRLAHFDYPEKGVNNGSCCSASSHSFKDALFAPFRSNTIDFSTACFPTVNLLAWPDLHVCY
jgi:hypothetical protein